MRVSLAAAVALLLALSPRPVPAQIRADPGVAIRGRVVLTVYVTLRDENVPYQPVVRHRMLLTGQGGDTATLRTDDAGVLSAVVLPGDYHLASLEPVVWQGTPYAWDVSLTVREAMGIVDLTPKNAIRPRGAAQSRRAPGRYQGAASLSPPR